MSTVSSIDPDAVLAHVAELRSLAGELLDDAALCRSTASSFRAALRGIAGADAAAACGTWHSLTQALAGRADALAVTLAAAVEAYLVLDARLAGDLAPEAGPPSGAGARERPDGPR